MLRISSIDSESKQRFSEYSEWSNPLVEVRSGLSCMFAKGYDWDRHDCVGKPPTAGGVCPARRAPQPNAEIKIAIAGKWIWQRDERFAVYS